MANTKIPVELSSTPSIVDNGNATAITIDSSENATFAGTISSGAITADGLTVDSVDAVGFITGGGYGATNTAKLRLRGGYGDNTFINGFGIKTTRTAAYTDGATLDFVKEARDVESGKALTITEGGDIYFYEDTGTTAKLFWDASAESLGIGGTPDTQLNIKNGDDAVVRIESTGSESGDDARLEIKTTNGTFTIQNDRSLSTSGALTFAGNTSDNLVIDHNDGTVGIGVSTPSGSGVLGTGHKLVTRANTNSGYVTTGGTGRLPAGLEIATQNTYQANDSLSGFAMQSNGAGGATMGGYIGFLPASTFGGGSVVIGATTGSNSHAERIRITNEGITFNGDTAAANAIDDYEEGTWTPNFSDTSGNLSNAVVASSQTGSYTKIGNLVSVQGYFYQNGSDTNMSATLLRIAGLPFTNSSTHSVGTIRTLDIFARQPTVRFTRVYLPSGANYLEVTKDNGNQNLASGTNNWEVQASVANVNSVGANNCAVVFQITYVTS